MRADILRQLIRAHAEGDEPAFRKAALQLAAAESAAGHTKIADDLRRELAELPPASRRASVVDIAHPRGELADVLEGGYREERLRDIVLDDATHGQLAGIVRENRARAMLERHGVEPRRKLLFYGPPGCGKTLAASVLAGEMGLPLMTARLASLFSRFLGATANHLRSVFAEMVRRPGVYLFDEFDSIVQARADSNDVGELRRVATAFLQLLETDASPSVVIAATNHPELLDRAVFRRFDLFVSFSLPSSTEIAKLVHLRLQRLGIDLDAAEAVAMVGVGLSYADVARACDDAIRGMVLEGREALDADSVQRAFAAARSRGETQQGFQSRS